MCFAQRLAFHVKQLGPRLALAFLLIASVDCKQTRRPVTTHGPSLHGAQDLNERQFNDVNDAKDSLGRVNRYGDQIDAKLIRLERGDYER